MKKFKAILLVALMSVASYGGYTAYEAATMTEAERALIENVEALANNENNITQVDCPGSKDVCHIFIVEDGDGNIKSSNVIIGKNS